MVAHAKPTAFTTAAETPLDLSPAQRRAILDQHGMGVGWLILSLAEMIALRDNMAASTAEVQRLKVGVKALKAERAALIKRIQAQSEGAQ